MPSPALGSTFSYPVSVSSNPFHSGTFMGSHNLNASSPAASSAGSASGASGGGHIGASIPFTSFPSVCTASLTTIDPSYPLQYDKQVNAVQLEYVWSHSDATLYEVGTNSATRALSAPGAIRFVFPPGTMIMAFEKDGSPASPAFTPMHPHSNEW